MSQDTGARPAVAGAAAEERPWADASRPLADRVEALLAAMTLDEKLAQLASVWIGAELGRGNVAPMQEAFANPAPVEEAERPRPGPLHAAARHEPGRPGRGRAAARRLPGGADRAHAARPARRSHTRSA